MYECQLAERRLVRACKRVERGEFVSEHGCLELLLAIGELLRELFGLIQVQFELGLTSCLKYLRKNVYKINFLPVLSYKHYRI